jgi:glycerate 2-kinase
VEFLRDLRGFRRTPFRDEIVNSIDYAFAKNLPEQRVLSFLSQKRDLEIEGKLVVVGFGKAGRGMYEGARRFFADRISTARMIIPAQAKEELEYPFLQGNHPFPAKESIKNSKLLIGSLKNLEREDLVLVLISGGGSSLFEIPRKGVRLEKYNRTISCMMKNGANIEEMNAVRSLFSRTKGGGLLNFTYPARVLSLIISDVPGDSESIVASGPTSVPQKQTLIRKTLVRYKQCGEIPQVSREKPVKSYKADNNVILKNSDFVSAIHERLVERGFVSANIGSGIVGNTDLVAKYLVNKMRSFHKEEKKPIFIVGGGETSTRFTGKGIGGRNLELTLKVLLLMKKNEEFAFGSIGTDGQDGTSGAMGAIVDNDTLKSLDREFIVSELSKSESLEPLKLTQDVLFTGNTGTNVADILIGYYAGIG